MEKFRFSQIHSDTGGKNEITLTLAILMKIDLFLSLENVLSVFSNFS